MKNNSNEFKKKTKVAAIDLFCGAGGLSHGLLKQSIVVKAGFDIDHNCKYPFEKNNDAPFILKDVTNVTGKEIKSFFSDDEIKIIAGCAPCQPFSKLTQNRDNTKNKEWPMLYEFARIVEEALPDIVTMENVPQVKNHLVFKDFENKLIELGYEVTSSIVFCPDYGIPQTRQRLVLLASRLGPISLAKPTFTPNNYKTVQDAIGKLPPLGNGERDKNDSLHLSSKLTDINFKRIKASKPDGTWLDWDKDLVTDCHKSKDREVYKHIYGRMSWSKPSPTITTQFMGLGNGRFGHPEQDRTISLREAALLQTFPKNYSFVAPGNQILSTHLSRMIGNAVPPKLGEVIGRSINKHLAQYCAH